MAVNFKSVAKKFIAGALLAMLIATVIPYVFFLTSWMIISMVLPKSWFHEIEDRLWGWFQRMTVFVYEHCTGVEVYVDGPIPEITENCLVISNHQCTIDWIVADFVALRQNVVGHMRYVFKDILKYYPLCGLGFGAHGGVFVKRDGNYNDDKMRQVMQTLIRRKATMYFMIYPEGTRFRNKRKDILKKSQDFAAKLNLKKFNQVLTPRVKAFDTALSSLSSYVDAVYDMTIIYDPTNQKEKGLRAEPPHVYDFLCGSCKRVYISYKRIPIQDVLSTIKLYQEESVSEASGSMRWLHSRFAIKDDLFNTFYGDEDTVKEKTESESKKVEWRRSILPLSSTLPAFLVAILIHATFLYYPLGRSIYLCTVTIGSVLSILYCHFVY